MNDYTLTVDEASKRLNKSIRTIHRYKNSGRLSHRVGSTQGNPILLSCSEVEQLARELFPSAAGSREDAAFWERLERVEHTLALVEQNPLLERLIRFQAEVPDRPTLSLLAEIMQQLEGAQPGQLDRRALGKILVQLGNTLLSS